MAAEDLSSTSGFTEVCEKIKKQMQEKLDRITAEIMRMEDETEKFIEQTKNFENNLKAGEGKQEVEEMDFGLQVKAKEEKKEVKEKEVSHFSKEEALASIKHSEVYKYDDGEPTSWPTVEMLREKSDETLKQLRVKNLEWGFLNGVIVSLRFTLNDGTTSNQIGNSEKINESLEFPQDKSISSVKIKADVGWINQLVFLDRNGGEIKKIRGRGRDSGSWYTFEVPEGENLFGFRVA